jgi:hypothetical protein
MLLPRAAMFYDESCPAAVVVAAGSGGGSSTHGKECAEALVQPPLHQLPGRKPKNNIHFKHCHTFFYTSRK